MRTLWAIALLMILIFSCNEKSEKEMVDLELVRTLQGADIQLSGKSLSEAYCGACHLTPSPKLLDKKTWETSVLPDMRRRMGLILAEDFGQAVGKDIDAPP